MGKKYERLMLTVGNGFYLKHGRREGLLDVRVQNT